MEKPRYVILFRDGKATIVPKLINEATKALVEHLNRQFPRLKSNVSNLKS